MSTALDIAFEDLVVSKDPNEHGCQAEKRPCSKVAVWRLTFDFPCRHREILYCIEHKDHMMSQEHALHFWKCPCGIKMGKLLNVEPVGR